MIVAAPSEEGAWALLVRREQQAADALKALGWQIAQDLATLPSRATIVEPSHYRRAVLGEGLP